MPFIISSGDDIELQFYDRFFFTKHLSPYPVQEQAFAHIFAGRSLLVTVPTGTGKTMMAKAGIFKALAASQTVVYTTPLRALTEEKYRELCEDFGEEFVGFATGDYKINPQAPVQVVVAEILWNQIFSEHVSRPADLVIMDEGHYFNSYDRGYVWEQSIIGLDPRTQLVILSATVGHPEQFCQWVEDTRKVPMALVRSAERRVPLYHEYRENYLLEVVKDLAHKAEIPAIVFVFGRDLCFETARLLKSCRRFTTDEEQALIAKRADAVLFQRGIGKDLRALLLHGIGIHHAGILPRYKRLVEELTMERLIKFVISTETIAAGINLPAKRVIFPSLRKAIKNKPRLLLAEEYHQMAGRAGRPQFDAEGIAITLAPEEFTQMFRKEISEAQKRRHSIDAAKVRKSVMAKVRSEAQKMGNPIWDKDTHETLVKGQPAPLRSHTQITADQILAIGLPDLQAPLDNNLLSLPPAFRLHMQTVVDHLLIDEKSKLQARKQLQHLTDNLVALGILDEHGQQQAGHMIRELRGVDGPFVYYCLRKQDFPYPQLRELVEFLVDHDTIHKRLQRQEEDKKREWVRQRIKELRAENPFITREDAEAEYALKFPRQLSAIEQVHQEFLKVVPHPELHGGKTQKTIWATMEEERLGFMDFVERHQLQNEEGNLFSYLARVMKVAETLHQASGLEEFFYLQRTVRHKLATIDMRVLEELSSVESGLA